MIRINRMFVSILLCAGLTGPAAADFETGLAAYYKLDYATALEEWLPLAEQGDAKSAYQLGVIYYRGDGVLQNHRTAAKWFDVAAKNGDADAQYNLAVMYANGQGVVQDFERSHMWFLVSDWRYQTGSKDQWALKSQEMAARNRDLTAAQMTEASVARARRRAEQMQSKLIALDRQTALQVLAAPVPPVQDCQTPDCKAQASEAVAFAMAPAANNAEQVRQDGDNAAADTFPIVSAFQSLTGPTGNKRIGPHQGMDIQAPKGTPVLAVADGIVYRSRLHDENGHEVKIKHAVGTAEEIRAQYANLDQRLVKAGDTVARGQVIGIVGDSGSESRTKMSFLHFALWSSSERGAGGTCCVNENPHDFWYDTGEALPIYRPDEDYTDQPHRLVYPLPAKSDLAFFKGTTTALNLE